MSIEKASWSLFNKNSQAQLTGLTLSQVRMFVASFQSSDLPTWMVWHEGLHDLELHADRAHAGDS